MSSSDVFLYVHVPFCVKRCLYCDFTSTTDASLIESYFESLLEDLKSFSNLFAQRKIRTVYFGGGTPTFVNPSHLRRVLGAVEVFLDPFEITLEVNPESLTKEKAIEYRDMGVSRLSVGVQAFDDGVLRMSGRPHGTEEVVEALELALNFFDRVNVDFIVGLPGYDFSVVEKNLRLIERFRPNHVSVYTLELHEETPLHRLVSSGRVRLPENTMEMFRLMREELERMGYERYEISNFAKEGAYSVHNLSYWYNLDYIGVGASAGGHVGRYRYVRTPSVHEYIRNSSANSYERENSDCEELKETLFMGLRLAEGIETGRVSDFKGFEEILEEIEGLVVLEDGRIRSKSLDDPEVFQRVASFDCGSR